jgi:hypothetical protein
LTENWRIDGLLADWRNIGGLADLANFQPIKFRLFWGKKLKV